MHLDEWRAGPIRVWQHWLGYRYPHYDEMERAARRTLAEGGLATVRVGFDPTTGIDAKWHVALYTPRHATPDAGTTRAAAEEWNPAGMLLHHVLLDGTADDARAPEDPRPQQLVRVIAAAFEAGAAEGMVLRDARASQRAREASAARRSAAEQTARTVVEEAIVDGLRSRCGFLLIPTIVVVPEMLADWDAYRVALAIRARLDPATTMAWSPHGVAVCRYCTTVFIPRTGGHADRCRLCRKRPAEPRVLGQCFPSTSEPVTVRAPRLAGNVILGWRTITAAICAGCGKPFTGRRDARGCASCTNRLRQGRHREQAKRDSI